MLNKPKFELVHASFNQIFIKLVDNQDRHEISDEFETGPHCTICFAVDCLKELAHNYLTLCLVKGERSLPIGLLVSWRLFDVWTSYIGIMSQYDPAFDLRINVGHCDLYFMVQWFCLISWRLFDVWTFDLKYMSLWPIFHGPVILPYILKTIWCMNIILWDYESVKLDIWPKNKYRSLWPTFHGPVILPYILKTI